MVFQCLNPKCSWPSPWFTVPTATGEITTTPFDAVQPLCHDRSEGKRFGTEKGWPSLPSSTADPRSALLRDLAPQEVPRSWFCSIYLKHWMEILVSQGMTAALTRSTKTSIQRKEQWADTYKTTVKWSTAKQKQFILIFELSLCFSRFMPGL